MDWTPSHRTEVLDPNAPVWVISDLHLGDGTPSDAFFGKDRHLLALVRRVHEQGATLVVAGDALDLHQAWTFTRILRAHRELLAALSGLAREGRLLYVVGNHDWDINLYSDVLRFPVCDAVHLGDRAQITHGMEFDPFGGSHVDGFQLPTKLHHFLERYLDTWMRVPLGEFYTGANRLMFWLAHKAALVDWMWAAALRATGTEDALPTRQAYFDYWARSQMGDPMGLFGPVCAKLDDGPFDWVLTGHSHMPGVVRRGPGGYANTGSWTFASAQYAVWDGLAFRVFDWVTGREFRDELYRRVASGELDDKGFWQWWRASYLGWFRFREGEERRDTARAWEAWSRDQQDLALLDVGGVEIDGRR